MEILGIKLLSEINRDELRNQDMDVILDELEKAHSLCKKLNQLIEYVPDGIYVTDGEANAIRINPAFERISGLDRNKMLGVNHRKLEEDRIISASSSLMVVREKKPVTIIHEYLLSNRQALVTSIPIFDNNGNIDMIVSSTRDLTELVDLKTKLAAEQKNRLKYEQQIERITSQLVDSQEIIATDKKTMDVLLLANRVSLVDSTVLITGETGVGKEVIAKYIHKHSPRKSAPYIAINCGAIPASLVESELFGYEKGAFTGARQEKKLGLLEAADKGTVFLDEVGELPMDMQVKLLRALETQTITRVGGTKEIPINVRIISATNRDLLEMTKENKFREDLYYRLKVVPIHIPPLRERRDDIIPLVNHFLERYNKKYEFDKRMSQMAYRVLYDFDWPGNVRELKNIIERTVVITEGDVITSEDLQVSQTVFSGRAMLDGDMCLKDYLEHMEYVFIMEALAKHQGVRKAAASLKMTVPTFIRKRDNYLKQFGNQK